MTYPQRTKLKTRLTLQKLCKDPQPALWGLKRNTVLLKGWVSIDFAYISKIKIFFFIFLNLLVSQSITWEKQRNEIVLALGVGFQFSSVQFSRSVVSGSLRLHESQHARALCPSPTPRIHSNSRSLSRWCHPAITSLVAPFSSCPQSLTASESFPMSQLFAWGVQSTGTSALAPFLPKKFQGWSPSEWTGWISLQSKGLSRAFSNTTVQTHQFFGAQPSSQSNSHIHTWPLEKP